MPIRSNLPSVRSCRTLPSMLLSGKETRERFKACEVLQRGPSMISWEKFSYLFMLRSPQEYEVSIIDMRHGDDR